VFIRVIHPWLTSSSVAAVQQRDTDVLRQLAKEFNLTYTAFGSEISTEDDPAGTLTLTDAFGTALEPAPVTPVGEDSAPWQLLSGTIKATYNVHRGLNGEDNIFVSPGIMTGNTGGCARPVCGYREIDNMECGEQIRGTIGTSHATLSGTATMTGETVSQIRTESIPSTNVCLDPSSESRLQVLISFGRHTS
jgi:hypothetical protein